jgi:outer membrane receptor protein involved in Fe transport
VMGIYAELSYNVNEKLQAKGGVRYEYTDSELIDEARGKIVDRKFGNFFPSLFLQYEINSDQNVNLQYSRRISRPSFSDMAPFVTFLDPNSSFGGNVALKPALAHNFLAGYQIKAVNFSLEYSHENNTIVRFQNRFDATNNKLMIMPDNLRYQQSLSFSMGFPTRFLRWWTGKVFATLRRQKSSTIEPLGIYTLTQNNLHINASQTITLPKEFRMELTGFYQTASLVGNVRFDPRATLNVAIQKKLKSNASFTIGVDDIFNSLENRGVTTIPEQEVYVKRSFDFSQRTFKVTFSKTFGNSKVKANRNRNSSDEEKNRVNN